MSGKNKFGFEPVEAPETDPAARRDRPRGPMATAVREAAGSLQETTEAKVAQRRQNAEDAKAFRAAERDGRVLVYLPLDAIATDDLPRDRLELEAVAVSDEMEELKSSIYNRGQKEPIEVYPGADGTYQLKKGWRRWTALKQLYARTNDPEFSTVLARIENGTSVRIGRYVDMVEENVVREDLSFAEMAQVAIAAARDEAIAQTDPNDLVAVLYNALHKTKRSYIRSFVYLLIELEGALKFPKDIARNLGVDVARALRGDEAPEMLRAALADCRTAEDQQRVLTAYLAKGGTSSAPRGKAKSQQKFEFFVGDVKVTARAGEFRIKSAVDYTNIEQDRLREAVEAFERTLSGVRTGG